MRCPTGSSCRTPLTKIGRCDSKCCNVIIGFKLLQIKFFSKNQSEHLCHAVVRGLLMSPGEGLAGGNVHECEEQVFRFLKSEFTKTRNRLILRASCFGTAVALVLK